MTVWEKGTEAIWGCMGRVQTRGGWSCVLVEREMGKGREEVCHCAADLVGWWRIEGVGAVRVRVPGERKGDDGGMEDGKVIGYTICR